MKHKNSYLKNLVVVVGLIKYITIFLAVILGIIIIFSINEIIESGVSFVLIFLILFFIFIFLIINFIFNIANTLLDMSTDITNLYKEKIIQENINKANVDYSNDLDDLDDLGDLKDHSSSNIFEKNKVDSLDEYLKKIDEKYN